MSEKIRITIKMHDAAGKTAEDAINELGKSIGRAEDTVVVRRVAKGEQGKSCKCSGKQSRIDSKTVLTDGDVLELSFQDGLVITATVRGPVAAQEGEKGKEAADKGKEAPEKGKKPDDKCKKLHGCGCGCHSHGKPKCKTSRYGEHISETAEDSDPDEEELVKFIEGLLNELPSLDKGCCCRQVSKQRPVRSVSSLMDLLLDDDDDADDDELDDLPGAVIHIVRMRQH